MATKTGVLKVIEHSYLVNEDGSDREDAISGRRTVRITFKEYYQTLPNGDEVLSSKTGTKLFNEGKEPLKDSYVPGEIITVPTSNYKIGDRTVNKITVTIVDDENILEVANKALARNNGTAYAIGSEGNKNPFAVPAVKTPAVKETAKPEAVKA